jgi:hypothetical protein
VGLKNLKDLNLRECTALQSLPERFGELTNLKKLVVPTHMQKGHQVELPRDLRQILEGQAEII